MSNRTRETYDRLSTAREDAPVIAFLKSLLRKDGRGLAYLEAGAGLGRFPLLLRDELHMDHLDITCLDINSDLAAKSASAGFKSVAGDAGSLHFGDASFDVVHCSHMIEHLGYPDIARALDEFMRVLKPGGFLIIRSPLMHPGFWTNIDHVRPYPPKTILLYFQHEQQQQTSPYQVELVQEWIRTGAWTFPWRMPGASRINALCMSLWNRFGFPHSGPTGYVAIFRKKA